MTTYLIPTSEQARAGLRAIKAVLSSAGELDAPRRATVTAVQRYLLRIDVDLDAVEPITPEALAGALVDPALREQLVNGMVVLTMLREHVDLREVESVERFAAALDVHPVTVRQLRQLAEERWLLLRLDVMRQSPAREAIGRLYEKEGLGGVLRNVASFAGLVENTEVADRYRALGSYADGTLGKELWRFYRKNDFRFPGEKGGAPETLIAHDLTHVLGGYGTDLEGEARVLAFTAGYRRENPHGILIFLIMQAQHGMRLTPFAGAYEGYLSNPALLTQMVEAFARGIRVKVDLMGDWDFWAVMDQPVEALRSRYGILPVEAGEPERGEAAA